jgi:DtxR family Mn-dependent transcriptional regulator
VTEKEGFHDIREELLEQAWNLSEDGNSSLAALKERAGGEQCNDTLDELCRQGLLSVVADEVCLTDRGREAASHVVRANRLAARLMTDLLELPGDLIEEHACRLEHAISPELADSLCTILGHPPTAPNGRAIPRGRCCESLRAQVGAVVRQLCELEPGEGGRITFIHPRFAQRLDSLSVLGIVPGTDIRLKQRHPSVVVEVGETTLALDRDVARDIFVKPALTV